MLYYAILYYAILSSSRLNLISNLISSYLYFFIYKLSIFCFYYHFIRYVSYGCLQDLYYIIQIMPVISNQEVLKYVNLARTNPKNFAEIISKEIDKFIDNKTLPLVPGCNYSTNEGKGAWVQCKNYLQSFKPVQPLKLSHSLCLVAEDHALDMAKNNFQAHQGSDGSSPSDRIARRCEKVTVMGSQCSGENIGGDFKYEGRDFPLNTVKSLLIDDGVQNRGHRQNILATKFHYIGIGSQFVGNKVRVVMVFHSHDPTLKKNEDHSQKPVTIQKQVSSQNQKSGKQVVSKKQETKTTSSNGKTVTTTTETIKYSDGSTQIKTRTQTKG